MLTIRRLILIVSIIAGLLPLGSYAQETLLARGNRVQGSWVLGSQSELLAIQDSQTLHVLENATTPTVLTMVVLPRECFVWCYVAPGEGSKSKGEILVQGPEGTYAVSLEKRAAITKFTKLSDGGTLFRGRLSAAPVKRDFAWRSNGTLHWATPTLEGLRVHAQDASGKVTDLGLEEARMTSDQSLGSGLGYQVKARMTVPFFAFETVAGKPSLLFRRNEDYAKKNLADGTVQAWGKAPSKDNTTVIKFQHRVPALSQDFDGDGLDDLIHVDPGEGTTLVYRSSKRKLGEAKEPDRAFKTTGHVLWRWLADGDGDGKKDLFLLEISRLNVIGQVKVMQKRSLPVVLTMRKQKKDGRFTASAEWSDRFELPCELSMTKNVRRVRFRAPIKIITMPNEKATLVAPDEKGEVHFFRRGATSWEKVKPLPQLKSESGFHVEPFATHVFGKRQADTALVVMLIREPASENDRVVGFKLKELR